MVLCMFFGMSGVEFITLLRILVNIEQLVEGSARLVKRAVGFYRDSKELPKMLEELQTVGLPLFIILGADLSCPKYCVHKTDERQYLPGLAIAIRRSDPSMLERLNEVDQLILTTQTSLGRVNRPILQSLEVDKTRQLLTRV
jgi:hypothetical protein